MSIRHLSHNEIDPEKWNELLSFTENGRIFSHYDFLTAVHPNWSALVESSNDSYISAFPITSKSKFGLNYVVLPVLTQQLQILNREKKVSKNFESELHKLLSKHRSIRLALDTESAQIFKSGLALKCTQRQTMVLGLEQDKDYYGSFAKKHQQSVRISRKYDFEIEKDKSFDRVVQGFLDHKAPELGRNPNMERAMKALVPFFEEESQIRVHSAVDSDGIIRAAGLFAGFGDTMTFLLSFSDKVGKKNCLMHAIILDWLENDSAQYRKLDFEGGNIKTLERFYGRFGADPSYFTYCEKHRFPLSLYFQNS